MNSLTDQITTYVNENPGCLRREIAEGLGIENPQVITDILCRLRRKHLVVNKIPNGRTSETRWYPSRPQLFVSYPNTMTREILNYIKTNPQGCRLGDILEILPEGTKPRSVNTILGYLKRAHAIENNGQRGTNALWYPVIVPVKQKYMKIAKGLQEELASVHHTRKTEYFARRLQELFDS